MQTQQVLLLKGSGSSNSSLSSDFPEQLPGHITFEIESRPQIFERKQVQSQLKHFKSKEKEEEKLRAPSELLIKRRNLQGQSTSMGFCLEAVQPIRLANAVFKLTVKLSQVIEIFFVVELVFFLYWREYLLLLLGLGLFIFLVEVEFGCHCRSRLRLRAVLLRFLFLFVLFFSSCFSWSMIG